jgi:hypothetical protein
MNGHKIIGIDIGLAGAVAVLDTEGILETIYDMPTLADGTKNRRTISAPLLHNILKENRAEHAFVEFKIDNGRSDAALIAVAGLIRAGKLK